MTDILPTAATKSTEEWRAILSRGAEAATPELAKSAAEGLVDAQLAYGQCLLDGYGVKADPAAALSWFMKAAHAGHPMGMNMVGRCCDLGWGTRVDKRLAAQWYDAAARLGLDWAMYNLATLHGLGHGVALDRAEALRLFRMAADRGHVKSITMLGSFHEDGWGVPRDMAAAADFYRRGAEGGDFRGQFNHARMLIEAGEINAAIGWLHKLPETATPAFLEKVRQWLAARPEAALNRAADSLAKA
ncbi:tetratricopeptide repeat protein [Novosphingobium sp. BL-8H]|uniref:tetratricopeptide repeat protein n=1 Tax=Novosphingobium sp. BL-8H TaxID=3127640 RepID=UPI003757376A